MVPIGRVLRNRYRIKSLLGSGAFGDTYLAEDVDLPGHPLCVVKHLRPKDPDPSVLPLARRFFDTEAQVLYRLGQHPQIPQLLAHFEENQEFYLVQEFVEGHDLSQELLPSRRWKENDVIALLQEILEVLAFVHEKHKVIHRDLKPQNIMRRKQDGKIVLIDFGAVKEVSTQVVKAGGQTSFTVAIGTPGYMPAEQVMGQPRFSSDVYAVGMIGIFALTGVDPSSGRLQDPNTGELIWQNQAQVSQGFAYIIINRMVSAHFQHRYASAGEAFQALLAITNQPVKSTLLSKAQALKPATQSSNQSVKTQALITTIQPPSQSAKTQPLKPAVQSLNRPFWKVMRNCVFVVLGLSGFLFAREMARLAINELERFSEAGRPFLFVRNSVEESLVAIQLQFDEAHKFSEGLALVKIGGKYGFIDRSGNDFIQPQFDFAQPFSEGLAVVVIGKKWGFIDKRGNIVVKPQFDFATSFSEGLAKVTMGQKQGFIDRSGNIIIQPQFDFAMSFFEGLAKVTMGQKEGFIDRSGNIIIQPQFGIAKSFSEGLAAVLINEKYGFIDKSGNIIIQPQFDDVDSFSEGLAAVKVGEKYGFIDKSGSIFIQPQFNYASSFSNGLARVEIPEENGFRSGFINKSGNVAVQPQFGVARDNFSEGLAPVEMMKLGFMDKSGNIVIQFQFAGVDGFSEGLAPVKIGEKWGYIRNPLK